MNNDLIICDIDGVLADCEHRLHYLKEKSYEAFYEDVIHDKLIRPGARLLYYLWNSHFDRDEMQMKNNDVIFLTGRPGITRPDTLEWIYSHLVGCMVKYPVLMRGDGDYRPSPIVKVELLKAANTNFEQYESVYFIDDDPQNVKAVCEAFPNITGITFGIKRMEEKNE